MNEPLTLTAAKAPLGLAPVEVTSACAGCGACLRTCPEHAIRPVRQTSYAVASPLAVDPERCTGCGECIEVCPVDAIVEVSRWC